MEKTKPNRDSIAKEFPLDFLVGFLYLSFEYYWFMGLFESFGLAQINVFGFDLTMRNLKSGSTCFWSVLVKKCTHPFFFKNI